MGQETLPCWYSVSVSVFEKAWVQAWQKNSYCGMVPPWKAPYAQSRAASIDRNRFTMRAVFVSKDEIPVDADPDFVVAAALVFAGVCADNTCGETQPYKEDRSNRPSAEQLHADHGAGALQVVREIDGRSKQPVSFWTSKRRAGDSD